MICYDVVILWVLKFFRVKPIYLWSKVVCFVLYWWDLPNQDGFWSCSWSLWKALEEKGCESALVPWHLDLRVQKVLEYQMISSLKIKLNCSWNLRRNWNVPLVLLERSWWAGFNGIYLVRFGFRMWEILIFALENPNKF